MVSRRTGKHSEIGLGILRQWPNLKGGSYMYQVLVIELKHPRSTYSCADITIPWLSAVDNFTLQKLYSQAYAMFTRGTPDAKKVGQTVLASQFVPALWLSPQAKGGKHEARAEGAFAEANSKELQVSCTIWGSKLSVLGISGMSRRIKSALETRQVRGDREAWTRVTSHSSVPHSLVSCLSC